MTFSSFLSKNKTLFFILLSLCVLILRSPSLYYTFLDVDESQFAGFAHVLMDGGLPYHDSLDTKPPLIYLFYAACFHFFGKYNMQGVHLMSLLINFLTAFTLYKIVKQKDPSEASTPAAMIAALFYVFFSTCYLPKFIATSITSIMVLPLALSIYLWLKGEKELLFRYDFLAGFFTALAFLLKYQAGIQLVLFGLSTGLTLYLNREHRTHTYLRFLALLVGFFLPVVILLITLQKMGVYHEFITWSLKGSLLYIQAGTETIPFWKNLFLRAGAFIGSTALIWVLAVQYIRRADKKNSFNELIILWFMLSWIPVSTGGRFYGHYFIQLLPSVCLLAALKAADLSSEKAKITLVLATFIPALFFWGLRIDFRQVDSLFPDDQIFEQEKIGQWLKDNTEPGQKLFVWGFATAIYFHAERPPASRFLWTDLLTGKIPGSDLSNQTNFDTSRYAVPEAWKALWEDFAKQKPDYIVDTAPANIHNYGKYPLSLYPELYSFVQNNYRLFKNKDGTIIYKLK